VIFKKLFLKDIYTIFKGLFSLWIFTLRSWVSSYPTSNLEVVMGCLKYYHAGDRGEAVQKNCFLHNTKFSRGIHCYGILGRLKFTYLDKRR